MVEYISPQRKKMWKENKDGKIVLLVWGKVRVVVGMRVGINFALLN